MHSIPEAEEFERRFRIFTQGQFDGWKDWDNMVVIGGAVIAALLPVPKEYVESSSTMEKYYHEVAYCSSDIDVYMYGLNPFQFYSKVCNDAFVM